MAVQIWWVNSMESLQSECWSISGHCGMGCRGGRGNEVEKNVYNIIVLISNFSVWWGKLIRIKDKMDRVKYWEILE